MVLLGHSHGPPKAASGQWPTRSQPEGPVAGSVTARACCRSQRSLPGSAGARVSLQPSPTLPVQGLDNFPTKIRAFHLLLITVTVLLITKVTRAP